MHGKSDRQILPCQIDMFQTVIFTILASFSIQKMLVTVVILKSSKFEKIIPGNLDNVLSETNEPPFL
jgi:hypothetical protein